MALPIRYTREYHGIPVHGTTILHIVCTTEPKEADKMLSKMHMKLGGTVEEERIIGVAVEYTPQGPDEKAAVLQLCVDKEVLVYHVSAAVDSCPPGLEEFLNTNHFSLAGFSIDTNKNMLKLVGIQIRPDKFVDIQREWRVPFQYSRPKRFDSLADVAAPVIDPFDKDMTNKINREEDHQRWTTAPLPEELITYAAIDAYATCETWRRIKDIKLGLERIKEYLYEYYS